MQIFKLVTNLLVHWSFVVRGKILTVLRLHKHQLRRPCQLRWSRSWQKRRAFCAGDEESCTRMGRNQRCSVQRVLLVHLQPVQWWLSAETVLEFQRMVQHHVQLRRRRFQNKSCRFLHRRFESLRSHIAVAFGDCFRCHISLLGVVNHVVIGRM